MENYKRCPHLYNLAHNYNFVTPQNEHMLIGDVAHGCLDNINTKAINDNVTEDDLEEILNRAEDANPTLVSNKKFEDVIESVEEYFEDYVADGEWKILESEYPFTIFKDVDGIKCKLIGQIDLIVNEDPDDDSKISLIDYKTSASIYGQIDYLKQLHLYALAIAENPTYGKIPIEHLIVFPLSEEKEIKDQINIDTKNELEKQIHTTALNVHNNKFSKTKKRRNCEWCPFKKACYEIEAEQL